MANFDFIGNRVFDDLISSFAPLGPQTLFNSDNPFMGTPLDTGAKVLPNGDVHFGFYAPNAGSVEVSFGLKPEEPLKMEKGDDGVWRATLSWDPLFCGPKAFVFLIDGAEAVSPYCPQYYSHGKAINFVEIPDPNAPFVLMRDVPHGTLAAEYYWSDAFKAEQKCWIYLPPEYYKGGEYPVLYLQHGAGENETSWIYDGRVNHIMDNLIADGLIEPFIVVMNDGMQRAEGETIFDSGRGLARSLIDSCIPMIERKYRVIGDKWHRAIAGFSMGSVQASVIGLKNTDVFAWIGLLSGFMRRVGPGMDTERSFEINDHLRVMEDRESFEKSVALYYRAIGSLDAHREAFDIDDEICAEKGFSDYANVVRNVVEGYPHDWSALRIIYRDFALRLFR
jgi:enterochelin esterase-like enzyme